MVGASAYDTEAALIDKIKGKFEGNDKTRTGSAFHKLIEGVYADVDGIHFAEADGYTFAFTAKQAKPALDYRAQHPRMAHELDVQRIYHTAFGPIQVTGRVDVIEGMAVRDIKTKYRPVDSSEYVDSIQWKFYCDMLGAPEFYYDVFEVKGFPTALPNAPVIHLPKEVEIVPFDPIHCLAYDGITAECYSTLNLFLEWVHTRDLFSNLKPALGESAIAL